MHMITRYTFKYVNKANLCRKSSKTKVQTKVTPKEQNTKAHESTRRRINFLGPQ